MVTMTAPAPAIDRRAIPVEAVETNWFGSDGWPIRRIDWKLERNINCAPRGSILFLVGRGDHYEKYLETLSGFAEQKWSVTAIDWRGQGLSGRFVDGANIGDIDDFSTWVDDLRIFFSGWKQQQPGPHVIIAHSMGGHLAMRAAIEKAVDPDAMVLIAPMLSIHSGGLPLALTRIVARLMVILGRGKRAAWKVSEKPLSPLTSRSRMLTHDQSRYDDEVAWWEIRPGLQLGPGSWRWVDRAVASILQIHRPGGLENVKIPVFIAATTADMLVSTDQIIKDTKRLPNAELLLFGKEAAHELLRESDSARDKVLDGITTFLDRFAPAP